MKNFILNSANADASTGVAWRGGTFGANMQLDGVPLGVVGGELAVKVIPLSAALPTGAATSAKQDTQITAEQAIVPGTLAAAVTPSDSTALTSRSVWVGGAGDLVVRLSGATGTTVTFTAVPAGTLLPISVVRVMAATTATNINVIN